MPTFPPSVARPRECLPVDLRDVEDLGDAAFAALLADGLDEFRAAGPRPDAEAIAAAIRRHPRAALRAAARSHTA